MLAFVLAYALKPHFTVFLLCFLACTFSLRESQTTLDLLGNYLLSFLLSIQLLYDETYHQPDSMFALWAVALFFAYKKRHTV